MKVVSETHTKLESWKGVPLAPERDHTILPRDRRDAKRTCDLLPFTCNEDVSLGDFHQLVIEAESRVYVVSTR